jgi:hypothetical protein
MLKKVFAIALIMGVSLSSCRKKENPVSDVRPAASAQNASNINPSTEIEHWKKELLSHNLLGQPCPDNQKGDRNAYETWTNKNPQQDNGLPADAKQIKTASADLDGDHQPDLLMYFMAENCSGHNGGNASFAKIVYANGSSNANLMQDIRAAIINQYTQQRQSNKALKAISDSYLESTTTIAYDQNINGEFSLYTDADAHCCPSYKGKYTYNAKDKSIVLSLRENKNQ